jgi:hypothetical protein
VQRRSWGAPRAYLVAAESQEDLLSCDHFFAQTLLGVAIEMSVLEQQILNDAPQPSGFGNQGLRPRPQNRRSRNYDLTLSFPAQAHSNFAPQRSTLVPEASIASRRVGVVSARTRKRLVAGDVSSAPGAADVNRGLGLDCAPAMCRIQEPITNRGARLSALCLFVVFSTKFEG